uniref:Uncharacterized protein n=1 Tax=Cucumis melo TaxID=3656 RepID=A0A9I9EJQ5_CUCME
MDFMVLGLQLGFRTCKKEEASMEVMVVIEKLFCSIRLDIYYRNHVVLYILWRRGLREYRPIEVEIRKGEIVCGYGTESVKKEENGRECRARKKLINFFITKTMTRLGMWLFDDDKAGHNG